jgi:pyridoxal phosphate enzyme (YggS family)
MTKKHFYLFTFLYTLGKMKTMGRVSMPKNSQKGPDRMKKSLSLLLTLCMLLSLFSGVLCVTAAGAYDGARVHIIGHLQKNKVKYVAGRAALIQSVDSAALMEEISRRAAAQGTVQDILLEINIGGEESKSGIPPEDLPGLLAAAGGCPGVRLRGLMTIPPPSISGVYFPRMYHLYIDNKEKKYDNVSMDFLSMGMSDDYEAAISEGANMIRVGSFIFGPRNYT